MPHHQIVGIFYPFEGRKGSFHIFVVIMIQCGCFLQWAPQHPLCFISCVFVWCATLWRLLLLRSHQSYKRKHSLFIHIWQNNGKLYAKIKYPTIYGKTLKFPYFSLSMRLFTKKLTGSPILNKISHLCRMIFCFLRSATCCMSHIGSLIFDIALERQCWNDPNKFLVWFFVFTDNKQYFLINQKSISPNQLCYF